MVDELCLGQMPIVSVHFRIARRQHDIQPRLRDHARDKHPGFHDGLSLLPARRYSENHHGRMEVSRLSVYRRRASCALWATVLAQAGFTPACLQGCPIRKKLPRMVEKFHTHWQDVRTGPSVQTQKENYLARY